jgi:hypothetical protein
MHLQDPWIQNATLRNNVLMGHSYEQGAYERAIHASCLGQDLEVREQYFILCMFQGAQRQSSMHLALTRPGGR